MDLIFGPPPFLSLVVGAKHSGKSELCRFICYQYADHFNYIVIITPTSLNGFYQKFIPQAHIHDEYDPLLVRGILDKQESLKKAGKTCHCLLIMDDILASEHIQFERRKASELQPVFCANRHYNLSCIVVTQKLKGLPKALRENVDYACICRVMPTAFEDLRESFGDRGRQNLATFVANNTRDYKIIRYKSNVQDPSDHFTVFRIPEAFLTKMFKLVY